MKRRGFTIVELVITITIIGILLTLAVVNMNGAQLNARDSERKGDIEAIALSLESAYNNNTSPTWTSGGTYPGTPRVTEAFLTVDLPGIDPKVLRAPGIQDSDPISLIPATNAIQTPTGVLPQPTVNQYVYQPITATGTRCTTNTTITNANVCRKFNLFYRLETNNTVYMTTSKNQ